MKKALHGHRSFEPTSESSRVGNVLTSLLACRVALAISISANASATWAFGTVTQVGVVLYGGRARTNAVYAITSADQYYL